MTEKPMGRPRKSPIKLIEYNGEMRECFEDIVTAQGTTGRIYPPKSWIGKKVVCICLE